MDRWFKEWAPVPGLWSLELTKTADADVAAVAVGDGDAAAAAAVCGSFCAWCNCSFVLLVHDINGKSPQHRNTHTNRKGRLTDTQTNQPSTPIHFPKWRPLPLLWCRYKTVKPQGSKTWCRCSNISYSAYAPRGCVLWDEGEYINIGAWHTAVECNNDDVSLAKSAYV